jgi:cytochrome c oxidase subunit 3
MTQGTSEAPQGGEREAGHAVLHGGHGHDHEHGHDHLHAENPFLQHHYDTPQQQFDAGKLGIWLFLVQEVLFFAGLFCAYTIYRSQHPEIFAYSHYFLDTKLGALNTVVLILSSVTAAWAVRCAQLNNKRGLIINIVVTIGCACMFMCVKYVEYSHKIHDGLLWGKNFNPKHEVWETESFKSQHPEAAKLAQQIHAAAKKGQGEAGAVTQPGPAAAPGGERAAAAAGESSAVQGTANTEAAAPAGSAGPGAAAAAPTPNQPATEGPAASQPGSDKPETAAARSEEGSANKPAPGTPMGGSEAKEQQRAANDLGGQTKDETEGGARPKKDPEEDEPKRAQTGIPRTAPGHVTTPGMQGDAPANRIGSEQKRRDIQGPGEGAAQRPELAGKDVAKNQDPAFAARQQQPAAAEAPKTASPPAAAPAAAAAAPNVGANAALSDAMQADQLRGVSLEGRDIQKEVQPLVEAGLIGEQSKNVTSISHPRRAHIFFGIYFFMTGLHGIHVLGGIIVWIWLLLRAMKGHFGESYFGPIDYAALYWHLVDLIWIYLFPLLYLID